VIAAAMRPGIDGLARRGIPRPAGLALHYLGLAARRGRAAEASLAMPAEGHAGFAGLAVFFAGAAV